MLLLLAVAAGASCGRHGDTGVADRPADPDAPGLVVENSYPDRPTFWDFGRVAYGSRPEHTFRVRNAEPDPVTVLDLLPSCTCTVPRVSYTAADGTTIEGRKTRGEPVIVIPPGAVADFAVRIETTHVERTNVDKLAQLRVRSTSKRTPFLTFELHLVVERAFAAVPDRIEIGESPRSAPKSGRVDVVREVPNDAGRILGIESVEGPFTATIDETEVQGRTLWILLATAESDLPLGPALGAIFLKTTRPDGTGSGAPLRVPVSAQIVPEVVLRPPVLALGRVEPGLGRRLEAALEALVPGERILVLGATLHGIGAEALDLTWEAVDADASGRATRWKLALATTPALTAREFAGQVVIETDHPRLARIEAPYSGTLP